MSDDVNGQLDPSAQGQLSDAGDQGQQQLDGQSQQANGIQQRINELTGRFHAADQERTELQKQNAELIRQMVELQQAQVQQMQQFRQPQEPPVEIDPDLQRAMSHMLTPYQRQMQEQMTAMQQTLQELRGQTAAQQVQSLAAQRGAPPEVVQQASQLLAGWQANPALASVATPEDALAFAMGRHAMQQRGVAQQSQAQLNTYNQMGQFGAVGQQPAPVRSAPSQIPANFDQWDEDKKLAYLESKVGDLPL